MDNSQEKLPELIRMEDFLRPQNVQEYSKNVHFKWRRNPVDNRLENTSMLAFLLSAFWNVVFFGFNGWNVLEHLLFGHPNTQNPPIFSITVYFSIRGLMLYLKRKDIIDFVNDLDREWPQNIASQLEKNMDQTYLSFCQRYKFVQIFSMVGLPMFCSLPVGLFVLTHEGNEVPVSVNEQLLGGWLPFGIRQIPKYYFFVWTFDVICTICGVSFFLTFDNLFNVMQNHLIMHLNDLSKQIDALDPVDSVTNEKVFFANLFDLVQRQQLLNELCRRYNNIFKVAFLVSNFLGAGSLCFMLFILSEASDLLIIVQYTLPTVVLIGFTFEICLRGTQLEDASASLYSSLTRQNWCIGSQKYRKFYLLWLQYSQRTQKLGGFGLIEVNMVHFTDIMQLAYRLFTFLKSH
ncbi:LOW QUALITY PROTEIN: uncharacterized protein Dana_GF27949 [Drosophila ananassae]|uniref:Odorant receptor n=1 Tax=Drosophila ananassae TaxID=7217 RepID=A0A0P8Y059_DROAN|nr:odorant receptor 88a [Drosophila ananassae]KPU80590.1 LOW QUALITY PROTEIN: uncharacterized protein Dana_GF27949 [Drosophila ananassae]